MELALVRWRRQCFASGCVGSGLNGPLYTAFAQPCRRRLVGDSVFAFIAGGFRVRLGTLQLVFNPAFGLGFLSSIRQGRDTVPLFVWKFFRVLYP